MIYSPPSATGDLHPAEKSANDEPWKPPLSGEGSRISQIPKETLDLFHSLDQSKGRLNPGPRLLPKRATHGYWLIWKMLEQRMTQGSGPSHDRRILADPLSMRLTISTLRAAITSLFLANEASNLTSPIPTSPVYRKWSGKDTVPTYLYLRRAPNYLSRIPG